MIKILIAAIVLLTPLVSKGQDRVIRVIYFKAPAEAPRKVFAHTSAGVVEVPLPRLHFSNSIELPPGELVIRFSERETLPPETPADQTVNLKLSANEKELLLFVYPDPGQKNVGLAIQKLSVSKLPPGEMMWINTTNFTVGGKVGSKTAVVRPGEIKQIGAPADKDDLNYDVELQFMAKGSKSQQYLFDGNWGYTPNARLIAMITAETGGMKPRVDVLRDAARLKKGN